MNKNTLAAVALMLFATGAWGAGGPKVPLDSIETDIYDQASLQRGLAMYMNYCMGCHGLQYQRYERTATDLGIPNDLFAEHLIFDDQKIGDLMTTAMPAERATDWFGNPPPDLTLIARLRGADWLYTYLRSFYADPSRPYGVNNTVYKDVGMPHVLQELQGVQQLDCPAGSDRKCMRLKVAEGTGTMSTEEFDQAIFDLVNFLEYVGEPSKLQSNRIGPFVLLFLVLLTVLFYMLKREYWKDVH